MRESPSSEPNLTTGRRFPSRPVAIGCLMAAALMGLIRMKSSAPHETEASQERPGRVNPERAGLERHSSFPDSLRTRGVLDPAAAAAWLRSLTDEDRDFRKQALGHLAVEWALEDVDQAADWALSLTDEAERDAAVLAVGHEAVRTEPKLALEMAAELPAGPESDELVRRAAMEWASSDAESAVEWARRIETETLRSSVLAGVALAWSDTDPVAAATLAADELPPGRLQSDTVVGVVQRWSQRDPEQAAAWVASFPEGNLRRDALANLRSAGGGR